jgi:hypothetical protein
MAEVQAEDDAADTQKQDDAARKAKAAVAAAKARAAAVAARMSARMAARVRATARAKAKAAKARAAAEGAARVAAAAPKKETASWDAIAKWGLLPKEDTRGKPACAMPAALVHGSRSYGYGLEGCPAGAFCAAYTCDTGFAFASSTAEAAAANAAAAAAAAAAGLNGTSGLGGGGLVVTAEAMAWAVARKAGGGSDDGDDSPLILMCEHVHVAEGGKVSEQRRWEWRGGAGIPRCACSTSPHAFLAAGPPALLGQPTANGADTKPGAGTAAPDALGTGTGSVSVRFAAPVAPAAVGQQCTEYTAVSTPGDRAASGHSSPLRVTGLLLNQSYSFVVYATDAAGRRSDPSAESSPALSPDNRPPSQLRYSTLYVVAVVAEKIGQPNRPSYVGSTLTSFRTHPQLPKGMWIDPATGAIGGAPAHVQNRTRYPRPAPARRTQWLVLVLD